MSRTLEDFRSASRLPEVTEGQWLMSGVWMDGTAAEVWEYVTSKWPKATGYYASQRDGTVGFALVGSV